MNMRTKYLVFTTLVICFTSCLNFREAMWISKNFPEKYTGLDTLIRIDGYYYLEYYEDMELRIISCFFSEKGRYIRTGFCSSHEFLQNIINTDLYNGSYTIVDDTIKTKWVRAYDLGCYIIFSEKYLIENDTTLKEIWHSVESPFLEKKEIEENDIFKFYEYKFDEK